MLTLEQTYEAISIGATYRRRRVDVVRVVGLGAHEYLQGQVSQDIDRISEGETVESFLLEPQGKLVAYLRIHCVTRQEYLLIVDEGFGGIVQERLSRFKLRVKADLSRETVDLIEVRGPRTSELMADAARTVLPYAFSGLFGVDLLGEGLLDPEGVEEGDEQGFEGARIKAGVPVMGKEITEKVIPQETGITDRTVSFSKGCYTGQELVARIDARGNNVAKRLLGFVAPPGSVAVEAGQQITASDREIGTVTSVARTADGGQVGLSYIRRDVHPPAEAKTVTTELTVHDLPLERC